MARSAAPACQELDEQVHCAPDAASARCGRGRVSRGAHAPDACCDAADDDLGDDVRDEREDEQVTAR